jgi:mannose-6-phosphate isomerase-like protein (cupin superfamily)
MKLIDAKSALHYTWGNNCDSWKLVDDKTISVKLEKMPANSSEKTHFHFGSQQFFYVLKGIASFDVENEKYRVKESEGIQIFPKEKHKIYNESNAEIEFLVISNPPADNDRVEIT